MLGAEIANEIAPHFVWFRHSMRVGSRSPSRPSNIRQMARDDFTSIRQQTMLRAPNAPSSGWAEAISPIEKIEGFPWSVVADPAGNEFCITLAGAH
jgi:hypothetical protein